MRESRTSGSLRGGRGNPVPYRYICSALRLVFSSVNHRALPWRRAYFHDTVPFC